MRACACPNVSKVHPDNHPRIAASFPANPFIQRLIAKAESLGVSFDISPVENQWLYHPDQRVLYVWEPDLASQSLSYLVVILAHELGHVVDFDKNPRHRQATRNLHWLDVPAEIELAAFVQGFRILKELAIPVSLDQYVQMIEEPMGELVRERIEARHLCCLLSQPPEHKSAG